MKNSCKVTKTGQKCINLTESHFKEIVSELENAAHIITNQKSEIESLEMALSASRDEIELLQESDRALKKEKKKLAMDSQKISSALSNEIETLKMELQHTQKQVEVWKGRTSESKASLRKFLESTIMDSGEDSINNGTYIESYESTIMNLKNQLDERLLRIEQLEMNYQNVNLERDELSGEVASLKAKNKANEYELRELREKQRKEENERKRFSMREEKLSHEIDSLCKKYNAEIDELQKKNILLNDEIWELNRIIKSNNNSIKELQDQNSNNKKYYEYYIAGKKVEDFITSKISDFESSVRIQLTALTNLVNKFEKNKMIKKNHHSIKGQQNHPVHTGRITTEIQSFVPVILGENQKLDTSEMEEINPGRRNQENHSSNLRLFENNDSLINNNPLTIATTASSGIITANNSQCVSNNNSNSPFILSQSQSHSKSVDLNSLQGSNTVQNDFTNNENISYQELAENIPPNYSELVKETMKVLTQASKDHQSILEKIQYLSDNIDDDQVINQAQYYQNNSKVLQNENTFENGAYYSIGKEEIYINRKQPIEDDNCSESSIISFLSEL
ncbi:hypothetical protein [Cryptosporidium parvum Iowa II]|uniref:Uncharacterized protein n=2 Tax=Cryptosporidium parvum TaxID=5807 RepID=A3FPX4_CRYPI|nr:hypothetical protein [Cryptosporidium parvum Iowa II]QOY41375.1 Uncharacterized protein CPATCC_0016500 [Cryptosporidium parvum]WKS78604.1 hypothetical protein CPCDC_6g4870 [Cryptosporidium sp. 43IA8]EAZ51547.1 hypothetical protein cgd6_4870 [Cryptosporidium parvum Iowa II]WRK33095.1 Uncharacterized protein cpbgf_6004870 [Cryptosporidium parvum]CAD98304.1 hypothetical predicted protein, unknown function [Cryptosporidium parvum]|eukprot:QOY41375.1 hypothetical protein CPATCC_003073 [Cryptosporidium parvum]